MFGGTGYESQRQMLRDGLDVLIGTPGRLIDYFKQKVFHLKAVRVAVLDEADRMFDLGFIRDIRYLLRRMPPPQERLSLLFSATLSMRVRELAYEHMNSPKMVDATPENHVTVASVSQCLYHVGRERQDSAPHRTAQADGRHPHHHLLQYQARGGEGRCLAGRERVRWPAC